MKGFSYLAFFHDWYGRFYRFCGLQLLGSFFFKINGINI